MAVAGKEGMGRDAVDVDCMISALFRIRTLIAGFLVLMGLQSKVVLYVS